MPGWSQEFASLATVVIDQNKQIKTRGQLKLLRMAKGVGIGFGCRPEGVSEDVADAFLNFIDTSLGHLRTMRALRKVLRNILDNRGIMPTSFTTMAVKSPASTCISIEELEKKMASKQTATLASVEKNILANLEQMFAENMDNWYPTLRDVTMHTEVVPLSASHEAAMLQGDFAHTHTDRHTHLHTYTHLHMYPDLHMYTHPSPAPITPCRIHCSQPIYAHGRRYHARTHTHTRTRTHYRPYHPQKPGHNSSPTHTFALTRSLTHTITTIHLGVDLVLRELGDDETKWSEENVRAAVNEVCV